MGILANSSDDIDLDYLRLRRSARLSSIILWVVGVGLAVCVFIGMWWLSYVRSRTNELLQHVQRLENFGMVAGNRQLIVSPPDGIPRSNPGEEGWVKDANKSSSAGTVYRNRIMLPPGRFKRRPTIVPSLWGKAGTGAWAVNIDPVKDHESEQFDLVVMVHPNGGTYDFGWMYVSWIAFDAPDTAPPSYDKK